MEEGFEYKVFTVSGWDNGIHTAFHLLEELEEKINNWDGEVIPTGGVTHMKFDDDYIILSQACIVESLWDDTNPLAWEEYPELEEEEEEEDV